jgi:transposase
MLYLGIDQHAKQLTIDLGDEEGNLVMHRQVSTEWTRLRKFLSEVQELAEEHGGFVAIVEVCGFNDYLLAELKKYGCLRTFVIQPEIRDKRKTDRRDSRRLRELLWVNRERLLQGKRAAGLRVVRPASPDDAADRQLTTLHKRLTKHRTRCIAQIKGLVRKHNLQHECPTKGLETKKALAWLEEASLPTMDRLEMDCLLKQWKLVNNQLKKVKEQIDQRARSNPKAKLIATMPGLANYGSLSVACRIGEIDDFPRSCSLANYWGLTPGSRNSGETKVSGHITKQGSSHVRYILGQAVLHILRCDAWMRKWYQKIKRRRGSKIGRVAVMRRMSTMIGSMLKYNMPYVYGGPEAWKKCLAAKQQPPQQQNPPSGG